MSEKEWKKYFKTSGKYGPDYTFAEMRTRMDFEIKAKKLFKNDKLSSSRDHQRMIMFKENHRMIPIFWMMTPLTFITEYVEKFALEAHQHGHVNRFISLYELREIPKPPEQGPQVLNMKKLSAGFIVWLGSVLVACMSFLIEHLIYYLTVTRKIKKKNKRKKPSKLVGSPYMAYFCNYFTLERAFCSLKFITRKIKSKVQKKNRKKNIKKPKIIIVAAKST